MIGRAKGNAMDDEAIVAQRGDMSAGPIATRVRQGVSFGVAAAIGLVIAVGTAHAAVVEKEGQRYEDALRVGGAKVVLNGVGVRTAGWFKAYVAGLYLPQKMQDAEAIYAQSGAKRIAVHMLVDVNSTLLAKTFDDGIRKNYKGEALEPLSRRMEALDAQIRSLDSVKKGEEVDLDFEPGSGTHVLVRGKRIGDAIEGEDFYVALLKMFIGERAVDKALRAGMLDRDQP